MNTTLRRDLIKILSNHDMLYSTFITDAEIIETILFLLSLQELTAELKVEMLNVRIWDGRLKKYFDKKKAD